MDPEREAIDKDREPGADDTGEFPESSSDQMSATPVDGGWDVDEQDTIDESEQQAFEGANDAAADVPASSAAFFDEVELPETESSYFPFLGADTPSAIPEPDVVPEAFAGDFPPSGVDDTESFAETMSGQRFAGAGIPASFARSIELASPPEPTIDDLLLRPDEPAQIERGPYVPNREHPISMDELLVSTTTSGGTPPPPPIDDHRYEPLGMMRPIVQVEDADRDGHVRAELDAFAERMTGVGKETAEAAVRYAQWFNWTEERRLDPRLRR